MIGKSRIGLFFGTFNPIHIGHLIIANHMAEYSDLDEIWFVITPHNPHKEKKSLLKDYHRLAMVDIAIESYPKLKSSNIEFNLPQPNYTVNTLAYLEERYPKKTFCLIMGEDNLKSLHKWKNYEIILQNYPLYVYPRMSEGAVDTQFYTIDAQGERVLHDGIHRIDAPIMELSSTFIRQAVKDKKDIRPMLPQGVWKYLDDMNFYK